MARLEPLSSRTVTDVIAVGEAGAYILHTITGVPPLKPPRSYITYHDISYKCCCHSIIYNCILIYKL